MKVPHTQVKKVKDAPIPITIESSDDSVQNVQTRLRACSVSVSMLKPPSGKPPSTPTTPNQALFPSKLPSQPASPSTKPNQGLSLLEFPLIRFITESTPYSDEEVNQYVIQAIKQREITYRTVNDEIDETPFMSKTILKGCRENSLLSNKKRHNLKR